MLTLNDFKAAAAAYPHQELSLHRDQETGRSTILPLGNFDGCPVKTAPQEESPKHLMDALAIALRREYPNVANLALSKVDEEHLKEVGFRSDTILQVMATITLPDSKEKESNKKLSQQDSTSTTFGDRSSPELPSFSLDVPGARIAYRQARLAASVPPLSSQKNASAIAAMMATPQAHANREKALVLLKVAAATVDVAMDEAQQALSDLKKNYDLPGFLNNVTKMLTLSEKLYDHYKVTKNLLAEVGEKEMGTSDILRERSLVLEAAMKDANYVQRKSFTFSERLKDITGLVEKTESSIEAGKIVLGKATQLSNVLKEPPSSSALDSLKQVTPTIAKAHQVAAAVREVAGRLRLATLSLPSESKHFNELNDKMTVALAVI